MLFTVFEQIHTDIMLIKLKSISRLTIPIDQEIIIIMRKGRNSCLHTVTLFIHLRYKVQIDIK